jgi:hypothetical protein
MRWLIRHGYIRLLATEDRAVYVINPAKRGRALVKWYVRLMVWLGLEPHTTTPLTVSWSWRLGYWLMHRRETTGSLPRWGLWLLRLLGRWNTYRRYTQKEESDAHGC